MSEELKPCPFCGEIPFVEWRNIRQETNTYLICKTEGCTAQNIHWDNDESWNTRPIEDELRAALVELHKNTDLFISPWKRDQITLGDVSQLVETVSRVRALLVKHDYTK